MNHDETRSQGKGKNKRRASSFPCGGFWVPRRSIGWSVGRGLGRAARPRADFLNIPLGGYDDVSTSQGREQQVKA